jgi:ATP-dependent DNA helicase RecG
MARRRFRSNQRHEPATERSFQEYYLSTPAPQTSRTELLRLIRGGEDTFLELKVKLSNPEKIAQEIVALANTGGGVIIFGVNDQLRIEGVDNPEGVQEELVRICREEIAPSLMPFIDRIAFDNGRRIVALDVDGKRRPYRTRDGRFYLGI